MGGDEFVVLLPDLLEPQAAEKIAANLVETLATPFLLRDERLPVSVSVGVCTVSAGETDADTLLANVDVALYHAKERGPELLSGLYGPMRLSPGSNDRIPAESGAVSDTVYTQKG